MKKAEYRVYIQSAHWQKRRKIALEANPQCKKCQLPRWLSAVLYDQDLHVHHLCYANLGHEEVADLQVLCPRCHEIETFGKTDLRELKRSKCIVCELDHFDSYAEICSTCTTLLGYSERGRSAFLADVIEREEPYSGEPVWQLFLQAILCRCFESEEAAAEVGAFFFSRMLERQRPTPAWLLNDERS